MDLSDTSAWLATRVADLLEALRRHGASLVAAESCTGGLLGACITDIPGSSVSFWGSLVTYSYRAKTRVLGVRPQTMEQFGAVSEECVREMVEGAMNLSDTGYGVAISGIAGPDGGTPDKPVGTVWFAYGARSPQGHIAVTAERRHFAGGRESVRHAAVVAALEGVAALVESG